MSNVAVIEPRVKSVLLDMSDRYGMEPTAFEQTLRATVVPANCTKEQFAAFLLVAKEYKLNPILKEIYAFPSKGGIQPIVGVDGWANLINSHPAFDGMDFEDHFGESGELVSITCRMYRKDRSHPVTATEYLSECKRPTEPWQKWPRRMLRHKAMIQAARYAFSFAGIIDPDEAERVVGDLARDVTPGISGKLAAARTIAPPSLESDGFSQDHVVSEIDGANSNSSQISSPETDTPASEQSPNLLTDAGNHTQEPQGTDLADEGGPHGLPSGWQATYAKAMTRVTDKPKSLANRRTEALGAIWGTPSEDDLAEMAAMEELVKRRNAGQLAPDEFKAQLREILPAEIEV